MATRSALTPNMFASKVFHIDRDYSLSDLFSLARTHSTTMSCYQTLIDYYRGKHAILERTFEGDKTKPNNKLVHNFPKLIVDNSVSYFMGKPVKYNSSNSQLVSKLSDIMDYNNETDENAELAKSGGIYGHAYEVLWIDTEGEIRFKNVSPANMFICYSYDIEEVPLVAVYYKNTTLATGETKTTFTIYTDKTIEDYVALTDTDGEQNITLLSSREHYFGALPVIEFPTNKERIGDFEPVLSLIDAYNLACSDSVNDVNYMNDAYLMLRDLSMTDDETVEDMKNKRILLVDGENGDAKWLVKNINDIHIQNIKNRCVEDIHKFSMTPNLADEKFASNLSGVAISYKLIGMENKTAGKERKFATALKYRLRLITNVLNLKGGNYDPRDIDIVFTRNMPQNLVDMTNIVATLQGIVPQKILLSILPFIPNVDEAIKELEKEQEVTSEQNYLMSDYDWGEGNEQEDQKDTREVSKQTKVIRGRTVKDSGNEDDPKARKKEKPNS